MALSESTSLIDEYSKTFTSLHAGKRELIGWGADAVTLNRFIVDAANETGQVDTKSVLQSIDISKVPHGISNTARADYCETALKKLISLQEEVTVLQKSAREKGISGGLLTIIGQAANQSPDDNGASVLRHLSELVSPEPVTPAEKSNEVDMVAVADNGLSPGESAANEIDPLDLQQIAGTKPLLQMMKECWKPLVIDVGVCIIASGIAISLIN